MKLSDVTRSEIEDWGIASGKYKGIDFSITMDRHGYYGALSIMFAEDGEHDGAINLTIEREETLGELKSAIKYFVKDFLKSTKLPIKQLQAEARKVDFGNDSWEAFQEFYYKAMSDKQGTPKALS